MKTHEHTIVVGEFIDGKLTKTKECGYSFIKPNDEFYTVKLYMNPASSFFLVKNKSNDMYTIYSRVERSSGEIRFKHPVGYGKLLENNKSYMQLKFHTPKTVMFMDLYAS